MRDARDLVKAAVGEKPHGCSADEPHFRVMWEASDLGGRNQQ